jgi:hypothetical protein
MELKINDLGVFLIGLVLGGILGAAVVMANLSEIKPTYQVEAVKHGAAHWVVADDGSTTFKWNEPIGPETEMERLDRMHREWNERESR